MAKRNKLRVIPLGGVTEIGKNATVLEFGNDLLLVDAGVKFPEEEMLGVDLVIPDFSYVYKNADRLQAILLTHSHEDHVGALPYLLQGLGREVPVYSSRLTLGLVQVKLAEHRVAKLARMAALLPGERLRLGRFEVEAIGVSHSIPDALAYAVRTPVGTLLHTGDFKLEGGAGDDVLANPRVLERLGGQGVQVLLSECLGVERPGRTPPERVVTEALDEIIGAAPGRVIVTTFASNIIRIEQLVRVAHHHRRKVAVAGRSLESNLHVAQELGYLRAPDGAIVSLKEANRLPPSRVVLLTTGSQGEPTSVLARIAVDDHPQIKIREGDTVILAASPIPGNEETVAQTIDNLFRRGARVIYKAIAENVHVSGHASREELRQLLELLKPTFCVPLHGEYRMMVLYRDLAAQTGIPADRVFLAELGDVLEFGRDEGRKAGTVPVGAVLVDGVTVGRVTHVVLRDRRRLAEEGVLIAAITVDRKSGQLLGGPDLIARGLPLPEDGALVEEASAQLRRDLQRRHQGELEYGFVVGKVKESLGKFIYARTRMRPLILPVVTEV